MFYCFPDVCFNPFRERLLTKFNCAQLKSFSICLIKLICLNYVSLLCCCLSAHVTIVAWRGVAHKDCRDQLLYYTILYAYITAYYTVDAATFYKTDKSEVDSNTRITVDYVT